MNCNELNKISNDLYNLMFALHKKILNPNEIMKDFPMPPSHVKVIIYLARNGASSISEVAKNLAIYKPNMTPIIDNLISKEFVTRYNDPNDRRIIRIALTDKARNFLKEQEQKVKDSLADKLSSLSSEDLKFLQNYITGLNDIMLKID